MRQFVAVAGAVALFMYLGFTLQHGSTMSAVAEPSTIKLGKAPAQAAPAHVSAPAPRIGDGVGALQGALQAAGAGLDNVTVTGWVRTGEPQARDRVVAALDWTGQVPKTEVREVRMHVQDGQYIVAVRWVMPGGHDWAMRTEAVQKALTGVGREPSMAVQLSGMLNGAPDLVDLSRRALDAVGATDRQPWSDTRAASVAGRSPRLPPGPYGVNVQVAARRDSLTDHTRIWVAWPALLQEY